MKKLRIIGIHRPGFQALRAKSQNQVGNLNCGRSMGHKCAHLAIGREQLFIAFTTRVK